MAQALEEWTEWVEVGVLSSYFFSVQNCEVSESCLLIVQVLVDLVAWKEWRTWEDLVESAEWEVGE